MHDRLVAVDGVPLPPSAMVFTKCMSGKSIVSLSLSRPGLREMLTKKDGQMPYLEAELERLGAPPAEADQGAIERAMGMVLLGCCVRYPRYVTTGSERRWGD